MRKFLVLALSFAIMATSAFAQGKKKYSDHYYKRTAQFEQERPITPNDIVMLGDSLTEGGDWASYFADWLPEGVSVVNRGIVGDDAPGIYDRLHQILPGKPKKIFLLVGVNDISHQITSDSVLVDIEKVVKAIRSQCPKTKLYIQSLLPYNFEKCI
ncbi:MAG: esterase, partial [Bacteroidales bacterium]|nr:esterase [Bacteroidales bacterium]